MPETVYGPGDGRPGGHCVIEELGEGMWRIITGPQPEVSNG